MYAVRSSSSSCSIRLPSLVWRRATHSSPRECLANEAFRTSWLKQASLTTSLACRNCNRVTNSEYLHTAFPPATARVRSILASCRAYAHARKLSRTSPTLPLWQPTNRSNAAALRARRRLDAVWKALCWSATMTSNWCCMLSAWVRRHHDASATDTRCCSLATKKPSTCFISSSSVRCSRAWHCSSRALAGASSNHASQAAKQALAVLRRPLTQSLCTTSRTTERAALRRSRAAELDSQSRRHSYMTQDANCFC
mmetsp:Transcript_35768/g.98574  ORF Transcript_35768/g.98574 Transcript_35768/m.98574 type:complete len:254 (-) Transcript_35768:677-1438(-)